MIILQQPALINNSFYIIVLRRYLADIKVPLSEFIVAGRISDSLPLRNKQIFTTSGIDETVSIQIEISAASP